jgi:hypothetical protein
MNYGLENIPTRYDTMPKERDRMHVYYRSTVFLYPHDRVIVIIGTMTADQAHKKCGRI